jgi:hypothetical protein
MLALYGLSNGSYDTGLLGALVRCAVHTLPKAYSLNAYEPTCWQALCITVDELLYAQRQCASTVCYFSYSLQPYLVICVQPNYCALFSVVELRVRTHAQGITRSVHQIVTMQKSRIQDRSNITATAHIWPWSHKYLTYMVMMREMRQTQWKFNVPLYMRRAHCAGRWAYFWLHNANLELRKGLLLL